MGWIGGGLLFAFVLAASAIGMDRPKGGLESAGLAEMILWRLGSSPLVQVTVIVVAVIFTNVLALWALVKIGGVTSANFQAKFKRFGGTVGVATTGLLGSFLSMVVITIAAILIMKRFLN